VGVGALYAVSHATTTAGNIFAPVTARWITSCYVTTLSTNLLATILLSYRLWKIDRNLSHIRANRGPLRPLLEIVLDAGLLYSVTLLATLSCFVAKSTGQYVTLDMVGFVVPPKQNCPFTFYNRSRLLFPSPSTWSLSVLSFPRPAISLRV
jgi:hypothetical protein